MKSKPLSDAEKDLNWLQHLNDPPKPGVPANYKPPVFVVTTYKSKPVPPSQRPQPPAPKSFY